MNNMLTVIINFTAWPITSLPSALTAWGAAFSTSSVMMALAIKPVAPPTRADRAAILPHASAQRTVIAIVVAAWTSRIRAAMRLVATSRVIMVSPWPRKRAEVYGLESDRSRSMHRQLLSPNLRQDAVQFVEAVIGDHQPALAAGTLLDQDLGAEPVGEVPFQHADVGVR